MQACGLGEMEFGNHYVALMDEISTGLDSAAMFDIVKTQQNLSKRLRKTIVMALLQPGPEVFDLFDDVMVLNQDHVLYHGPCTQAVPYFRTLGLECPPDRDVADLIDIGTPKQAEYVRSSGAYVIQTPMELAKTFRESPLFQSTMYELSRPVDEMIKQDFVTRVNATPEFNQSFWASTLTLLKRELRVTWCDKALMISRLVLLLIVGFLDSTLYFDLNLQNTQFMLGTIFGIFLYLALNQPALAVLFIKYREIFYKQRDANFFRTSSYVLAVAISQLLLALPDALIFSTLIYWCLGLVNDFTLYLSYTMVMYLLSLAFTGMTFVFTMACSTRTVSQSIKTLNVLIFTLFGGLFIVHKQIPDYFVWAYWLNPLSCALRSVSIAHYGHESFEKCTYGGVDYCASANEKMGTYSLKLYDIYTDHVWIWAGMVVLFGIFIISFLCAWYVLENVRFQPQPCTAQQ